MEEHFSIAEAAAELRMTEAAVLRACLDEQLDLSIRFSGRNLPCAKLRRQLPMEAGYPLGRVKTAPLGLYDRAYTMGSDRSLWTLVMAGSGRLCVEDEYQKAIGRTPAISDSSPSSSLGVFVSIPDESMPEPGYVELRELVEYRGTAIGNAIRYDEDFHAVHVLPAGSELVVAKKALIAYQAKRSADTTAGRKAAMIEVIHKPEWSVWREVLRVTLREAVSLSCNADPKAVALGPVENFVAGLLPQFAASDDVNSEISRRLTIARSHAGTGGTLPTVKEDEHTYVQLATFSDWAMNVVKWPVPDEMRAFTAGARPIGESQTTAPPIETPEARQRRRLTRFRELGGDIKRVGGNRWQLAGTRGALAALAREEKTGGRARHDASDVRKELERAAEAAYREKIGS